MGKRAVQPQQRHKEWNQLVCLENYTESNVAKSQGSVDRRARLGKQPSRERFPEHDFILRCWGMEWVQKEFKKENYYNYIVFVE